MRSARANKAKLLSLSQSLLRLDKSKLSARDKLYIQAIDELTGAANLMLQKFKTVFNQVLQSAGSGHTELEQIELHQFASIIRSIDRAHTREPGYDIIMHLFQIYDACTSLIARYRDRDSRITEILFDRGIQNIEFTFNENVQKAIDRLSETVQVYLRTLPEVDLEKEPKISHWQEKSKNEIHPDKKVGVLMEFFATYDN